MLSLNFLVVGLVGCALSAPVEKRASSTENELTDGECRDVTFIMARGSTEIGNMVCFTPEHGSVFTNIFQGSTVGPTTCQGLKDTWADRPF